MSHENSSINELLDAARLGDDAAAHALVERLHPLVRRVVCAHLPRGDDAADLVHDVFLKMFAKLDHYRGGVPFEHWLARVAVNTCRDRLRSVRRRPAVLWSDLSEAEQALVENRAAEDAPADALAAELLKKLLDSLAPADRLLITLLDMEQRTPAEVAAMTGMAGPLVRLRAFRARRRLRALYESLRKKEGA